MAVGPRARRSGLPARDRRVPTRRVREDQRERSVRSDVPTGGADVGVATDAEAARAQEREALQLAHRVVELAEDRKASDIVLLAVAGMTTLTDYFVICSGGSERQLAAITDGISEGLKQEGYLPIGREGSPIAHWLLLDFGAVIVHVMAWPERDYYGLEKLWSEAPLLLRIQ